MTITLNVDAAEIARTVYACRLGSPFGELMLGVVRDRICWLQIGDVWETAMLERYLAAHGVEHPEIIPNDLPGRVRLELEAYFSGEQRNFTLALMLFGTDFQKRVWEEIRNIPFGATITYAYLASRLGNKNAVRAVGAAVGSNPVPLIVPCHRVIGSNGSLTGYAYGVEVKRELLVHEGALLT